MEGCEVLEVIGVERFRLEALRREAQIIASEVMRLHRAAHACR
jgi:hypothetical protein